MTRNRTRNLVVITAILILTGAGIAWAHDGWGGRGGHMRGYGGHMMDYGGHMRGYGGHMMGPGYGPGYGDLSKEDYNKLQASREKFFDQTRELRSELNEKHNDIQREMTKENPDRSKITSLQKDIYRLRAEFDAKALDYELEVRKMMPESARQPSYAGRYRRGYCW